MPTNWFAKHFACWSGGELQEKKKKRPRSASATEFDQMSITRCSKRFGGQPNCAKQGCDKFCKNNCNLSSIRNDLKGCGRRNESFNLKGELLWLFSNKILQSNMNNY